MNHREIENKLRTAVEHNTPDVLEGILRACQKQEGKVFDMSETMQKKKRWTSAIIAVAAAIVLLVGSFYGYSVYQNNNRVDSIVSLDVNPSVELRISQSERVLEAIPVNEDAVGILDDMDLTGSSLDVAVNALIGSMLKNGYIDELANSILISVENPDDAKSQELQARLTADISSLLQAQSVNGAILSQALTSDEALLSAAQSHNISLGKASLIQKLIDQNPLLSFDSLAQLSVNELNLLAEAKNTDLSGISSFGTASDKAYIGEAKAKEAAFSHAGVSESSVQLLTVELDCDDGRMVYDVEFYADNIEYDYEIDALNGTVLKYSHDIKNTVSTLPGTQNGSTQSGTQGNQSASSGNYIGDAKALQIALSHAGISSSEAVGVKIEFEFDDGVPHYDVEFYAEGMEYDYKIHATTGDILSYNREHSDDWYPTNSSGSSVIGSANGSVNSSTNGSANYIGETNALQIALSHAGLSSSAIARQKIEFDYDDGVPCYEIEFYAGRMEYNYKIHATTGDILEFEQDYD